MTYPDNKETWTPKVDRDLSVGERGSIVDKTWFNNWQDFLERLQDTLGLGIKMGYGSLKLFLDYVNTQIGAIAGKVAKAGDTMTGTLVVKMDGDHIDIQRSNGDTILKIHTVGVLCNFKVNNGGYLLIEAIDGTDIAQFSKDEIFLKRHTECNYQDLYVTSAGYGLVVKTPNGSTEYRIRVDNDGNIVTETF